GSPDGARSRSAHVHLRFHHATFGPIVGAKAVCETGTGATGMETQQSLNRTSDCVQRVLEVRPLSPALGAEIIGVDLRGTIDDFCAQQMLEAWHENLVILLRDQELDEDDQVRFAERFGPLARIHTPQHMGRNPAVMLISNIREDGKPMGALPDGEMQFHTDQCYQPVPAKASMLYAIEIPRQGGNTLFANAYRAYETLPEDIKRRLEGRRALNAYDYDGAVTIR